MPGPLPKKRELKRGHSKQSTSALLPAALRAVENVPKLPAHPEKKKWHPLASAFWTDVWRSPMAAEYVEADIHGIIRMLILTDRFMREPSVSVSAELRLLSQNYGLSPIDRRRLQWTVAKSSEAVEQVERKRAKNGRVIPHNDPREVLDQ